MFSRRVLQTCFAVMAMVVMTGTATAVDFFDDFDSYIALTDLHGLNGWAGWDDNVGAGAPVSDAFALKTSRIMRNASRWSRTRARLPSSSVILSWRP